ncbi:hypothetical protein WBN73_20900 [Paenarthrobacter sp. CCNWLY172]|uniref:hypothetical protein n=1 Tax=unclassified Paenarthrobacter TaxID=2634190 RepID=UPI00307895F3
MSESTDSTPKAENPFTKPWFLAAGGVIVVIIVLAVVYALLPPVGAAPNAQPTPTADKSSSAPSAAPGDSVCGLPKGDPIIPGPGLTSKWELVGKIATPTAPEKFGPGKVSADGVRTCFAHNPTGALYAATNVLAMSASGRQAETYKHLAASGPERDAALATSSSAEPVDVQVAGYQYVSYSADSAVVTLGVKFSNDTYFTFATAMKWENGDWKTVLPPASGQQVKDLSTLIPWSGV